MREGRGRKFLAIVALLAALNSNAQEITVTGGFVEDSLLIGQNVNYWITATYPAQLEMVFPDSNYTFSPFEYSSKKYFNTLIKNGLAYDSTIYTIQSFEIDPVQYLQLKAVILNGTDSTELETPIDSIFLTELAPFVSDSTKLKTNLEYQSVGRQFNYPLLYYIVGGIILLTIILLLIFGKRLVKYFKLKKLARDYNAFSESFNECIRNLKTDPKPKLAEQAISIWKKYQQRLDKVPFTVLTTKEILEYRFTEEIEKPLKAIDRVVYGNHIQENVYQDFQQIDDFTQQRFNLAYQKIKESRTELTEKTKNEEDILFRTDVTQFGLTMEELNKELLMGGKFVVFYYTISVIFLSFKRTTKVRFLKSGESGIKKGIFYTLITFLFGWWGIPWGIIYTFQSLHINLRGGKDVTQEILKKVNSDIC